jgi:hypothetical protein
MKRLTFSLLAATLLAAPVASSATVAGAAVAFAQTVDEAEPAICPVWYGAHIACVPARAGEPERAAPPAFSTRVSDGRAEAAAPLAEDKPAFLPIEATPATTSSEGPYYGPGWNGPVNHTSLPVCPAWYGAHTECVPVSTPTAR